MGLILSGSRPICPAPAAGSTRWNRQCLHRDWLGPSQAGHAQPGKWDEATVPGTGMARARVVGW